MRSTLCTRAVAYALIAILTAMPVAAAPYGADAGAVVKTTNTIERFIGYPAAELKSQADALLGRVPAKPQLGAMLVAEDDECWCQSWQTICVGWAKGICLQWLKECVRRVCKGEN